MKVDWVKYNRENKNDNIPVDEPLWVYDTNEGTVEIGYWLAGWWETTGKGDDINVSHWALLEMPEAPSEQD